MNDKTKTADKKPTAPGAVEKTKREPRTAEQKAAKFKELAQKRVSKALATLRGIGNLASPNYAYTDEQVGKICAAVDGAVSDMKTRFTSSPKADKPSFSL